MRGVAMIGALAAFAIATPAMAQGRGRDNDWVPPGQRAASGLCRTTLDWVPPGQRSRATDCVSADRVPAIRREVYGDRNGQVSQAVYTPNSRIMTRNGQRCVQRTERNGAVRTICADGDNDRDDRVVQRAVDQRQRKYRAESAKYELKHQGDYRAQRAEYNDRYRH